MGNESNGGSKEMTYLLERDERVVSPASVGRSKAVDDAFLSIKARAELTEDEYLAVVEASSPRGFRVVKMNDGRLLLGYPKNSCLAWEVIGLLDLLHLGINRRDIENLVTDKTYVAVAPSITLEPRD